MTIDVDAARQALEDQRGKLVHQLSELGATESGELRADVEFGDGFADAGAATAERTEVLGIVETLRTQLEAADGALAQIENGSYGTCKSCGEQIDPARLAALPTSILCVDCKSKHR